MIHPAVALAIGLLITMLFFAVGVFSGSESDGGHVADDSIDQSTSGYEADTTDYSGDDLGSSESVDYNYDI